MIHPLLIAVADDLIAVGEIEIALRPDDETVDALVHIPALHHRQAPHETPRLDARALLHRARQQIDRGVRGDVEIVTPDCDVIHPRVLRETEEQLARRIQSARRRLINKERLATARKEPPGTVELQAEEGLALVAVDDHGLQTRHIEMELRSLRHSDRRCGRSARRLRHRMMDELDALLHIRHAVQPVRLVFHKDGARELLSPQLRDDPGDVRHAGAEDEIGGRLTDDGPVLEVQIDDAALDQLDRIERVQPRGRPVPRVGAEADACVAILHHAQDECGVPSSVERRPSVVVEAHADVELLHELFDQIELVGNEPHAERLHPEPLPELEYLPRPRFVIRDANEDARRRDAVFLQMRVQGRHVLIAHLRPDLPRLRLVELLPRDKLDHRPARLCRLLDGLIDREAVEGEGLTSGGERRGTFGGLRSWSCKVLDADVSIAHKPSDLVAAAMHLETDVTFDWKPCLRLGPSHDLHTVDPSRDGRLVASSDAHLELVPAIRLPEGLPLLRRHRHWLRCAVGSE